MRPLVEVAEIAKRYTIRHQLVGEYGTLRDDLARVLRNPLVLLGRGRDEREAFWALTGISFNVNAGEAVALIGKNGSGKSTLLKILSRIVLPTSGRAVMRGPAVSLLEVGTGFHPELSGRENIYFNGALLGMTKQEISRKFGAIVDFAAGDIKRFLDTPVKFYSSGMYVRLAFAIAAQLGPDILIVDEVLAVGDAEFQQKCLAKMENFAGEGRAVIFVSHDMRAVSRLCNRGIFLSEGRIAFDGPIDEAVAKYEREIGKLG